MLRIYLVRHGQTEWNATQRYQGHTDIPLDTIGLEQAERAAARLVDVSLDAVYSSDLSRAAETAQAIADLSRIPRTANPLLREHGFGQWEGRTRDEIEKEFADSWLAYRRSPLKAAPPNGETLMQTRPRVLQALSEITQAHPDGAICIVGHGGSMRWIVLEALGAPPESYFRLRTDNGSLSLIERVGDRQWLSLFNDTSHLRGLLSDPTVSTQLNTFAEQESAARQRTDGTSD
jgi:alpha-ribazole phosphatase